MENNRRPLRPLNFYKHGIKKPIYSIQTENIHLNLKARSKETVINELLDILETNGKLLDRAMAYRDILEREKNKTTGIPNGIAIPRAKTTALQELTIVIGIKKSGLDFDSPLEEKTRIIILVLAPPNRKKVPEKRTLKTTKTALNPKTKLAVARQGLLAGEGAVIRARGRGPVQPYAAQEGEVGGDQGQDTGRNKREQARAKDR